MGNIEEFLALGYSLGVMDEATKTLHSSLGCDVMLLGLAQISTSRSINIKYAPKDVWNPVAQIE